MSHGTEDYDIESSLAFTVELRLFILPEPGAVRLVRFQISSASLRSGFSFVSAIPLPVSYLWPRLRRW